ncbi:MAG TPA: lipopolysaccharide transport periplasmic protein LptA [Candidatus Binatia bacterium]|nr:lipopolysaccharide transport periplasmic protein LptA [Candidatus Binatia bacterium]
MKTRRAKPVRWIAGLALCLVLTPLHGAAVSAAQTDKKGDQKAKANQKSEEKGDTTKKKSQSGAFSAQDPIYITSDRMEADRQKNIIIYTGQVVAIQNDMTLRSDKLTTYFDPDLQQIKEAIAEGKQVRMTQGDRIAIGTKAVFDGIVQTVTMTGNPIVRQGNSEVAGCKIIYFMVEDRVVVENCKDVPRVAGTIFPAELQQKNDDDQKADQKKEKTTTKEKDKTTAKGK